MKKWGKPNKDGLLPRWKPTYGAALKDAFLGYVGPFDVWFDDEGDGDHSLVVVVCDESTKEGTHNFDTFRVFGDLLERDDAQDLHIGLDDMCLIYQLCVENEIFVREDPNG